MATLAVAAAVHLYWAAGGQGGLSSAVPSDRGVPLFKPPRWAALMVALALLACGSLAAAAAGLIAPSFGSSMVRPLTALTSLVFAARAIGDFRNVGFFKNNRGSRFGALDTVVYSPLCAFIGCALLVLAIF